MSLAASYTQKGNVLRNLILEKLWNGYIWPFATSQTLKAVGNLLHNYNQEIITKEDFYEMLHKYAVSQHRKDEHGNVKPCIDEVIDPHSGQWSSRDYLKERGWIKGGYERGKDYNHSTFCDLILSDLFGIRIENGKLRVTPIVPDDWDSFKVENLYVNGKVYTISYKGNKLEVNESDRKGA